ncbi:MAG: O-methyltransferase [Saprospiraceae bacterium]|nr:O-methyltransferase [Saprospiraceae bacterium]
MQDILEQLYSYAENQSKPSDDLLLKIERETHLKTLSPRMLSGHLQGHLLTLLSILKQPKTILEIGTFTGYSAVCLSKGLVENGKIISVEYDSENADLARSLIKGSLYEQKIDIITGDARQIIQALDHSFDMVFIDADKESYRQYYDMVLPKCNSGALIIADNVLWSGKVLDQEMDKKTRALHDFNDMVRQDVRVENFIIPFRDGLNMMIKK